MVEVSSFHIKIVKMFIINFVLFNTILALTKMFDIISDNFQSEILTSGNFEQR